MILLSKLENLSARQREWARGFGIDVDTILRNADVYDMQVLSIKEGIHSHEEMDPCPLVRMLHNPRGSKQIRNVGSVDPVRRLQRGGK